MAGVFEINQGDLSPSIAAQLELADGSPVVLTGATVTFMMETLKSALIFERSAQVTDAVNGYVAYSWQAGDTDTPGIYKARWRVTFSGGGRQTYPRGGYNRVRVWR